MKATNTSLRINKLGNAKQSVKDSHSSKYLENSLGTSFYKEGVINVKNLKLIIYLFIFFFIACLPSVVKDQKLQISNYIFTLKDTFFIVLKPQNITFTNIKSGVEHDIFPFIIEPWLNTMIILFGSILISLIVSLIVSFFMYSNRVLYKVISKLNNLLSIIPDIFYIPFSILVIIFVYIKTNILIFDVASSSEKDIILFPMLLLSVIPITNSILIIEQLLKFEINQSYIDFAKSKGLSKSNIFFRHLLRNILFGYLINFKQIVWITLSSSLFLERILNVFGVSVFIFEYNSPEVLFISFLMLFIPISLLFFLLNKIVTHYTGEEFII
ncbi:ABC transporter permease subunit [Macrococcus caseolyticus]|uniref:ABC transporter permease subunit n=1 Tax=Macrococcoides caseolyticum TaxID=69966 RepID=UPI0024BD5A49|nr:ABC transporter permease subunit [Macrococcus caseolyticus]MDJ1110037.1 ABC transporter permease subunit [Macrococcus caseolyticus]